MKLAGPGLLLAPLLLCIAACSVAADKEDKPSYDLLVLQLEWAPNECIAGTCADKPFGAFSVNQLVPTNADRENPSQEGGCPSTPYDASQIPPEVQAELQCIFYNPSGDVEGLWQDLWNREGRCSGLTIGTFFAAIAAAFNQRDVNAILASEGLVLPADSPGLDRDTLLDALDKNIARTFVQCDPATKRLRYVDICLDPKNLRPRDCPWWKDRYSQDPSVPGGMQCSGTLLMLPGAAPSPECQAYYPRTIPGAVSVASVSSPPPAPSGVQDGGSSGSSDDGSPTSSSSSGSGGSNAAAIAGGVIGGIVAAVALAAAFVLWRRRSARRPQAAPVGKAAPAHGGSAGGSLTDSFIPAGSRDVEAGGVLAAAALLVAKKSADASFSSQSQGTGPRLAATPDYGLGSLALSTPKQEPLSLQGNSLGTDVGGRVPSGSSAATAGSAAAVRPALGPSQSALWLIRFEELTVTDSLGAGSFGKVYAGEWNSTPVAIKLLLGEDGQVAGTPAQPSPMMLKLEEEAEIMLSLRHPNIVSILGLCQSPPCIVLEFMERGSLTSCLQAAATRPAVAAELTWQRRLSMLLDAAKGLTYLHNRSPPIIHRDLKSPNLLADKHWRVKVTDFNLSKYLSESARNSSAAAMNPRWLAPEVMKGEGATRASDVFSFAVVMWEMLTWQLPYTTGNSWQVATHIMAGGRLPIPPAEQLPGPDRLAPAQLGAYLGLMERCWQQDRDARPSFAEVIGELRRILQAVESEGTLEPAE